MKNSSNEFAPPFQDAPLLWGDLTWEEVGALREAGTDMVILPVGATEQHGPHLSCDVDTVLVERVAHAVSARTRVPVLPTLPYGCSLGHTHTFPGTLSLRPQTLSLVVEDVLGDAIAYGFSRVLVLSGHSMNAAPLRVALELLRERFPRLQIAQKHLMDASPRAAQAYTADAQDFHANCAETALMMHLAPDKVRAERIEDDPDRTQGTFFSYTVPFTSKNGVTGSPSLAEAFQGADLFEMLVEDWTAGVRLALVEQPPLPVEF